MKRKVKIAVTGAAGQIGYALVFRIASGEMFGPHVGVDLRLLELPGALGALKGVRMELEDCAFGNLCSLGCSDNPDEVFNGADWALLVGSVPRKAGMERGDLLKINAKVFIEQGQALSQNASPDCKVLVVGNPCNTNAYIAKTYAKNLSQKNFFAMTLLDQNRAMAQIARKANVPVGDVRNLAIWGNHSATQFPDFFHATVQGKPVVDVIQEEAWLKNEFIATVQKRGAAVIQARGLSSAASAANAIVGTVRGLTNPTPKNEFFSVAVSSDGSYDVPQGLMFSFPVSYDGNSWRIVEGIAHNNFAKDNIAATLQELTEEAALTKDL